MNANERVQEALAAASRYEWSADSIVAVLRDEVIRLQSGAAGFDQWWAANKHRFVGDLCAPAFTAEIVWHAAIASLASAPRAAEAVVPLSVAISSVAHVARANYPEREREAQQWLRDAATHPAQAAAADAPPPPKDLGESKKNQQNSGPTVGGEP